MNNLVDRLDAFVSGGRFRRHGLAVFLGALSALALPPVYFLPVLLVSFPALVLLLRNANGARQRFLTGWWFGLGHFTAGLYWIAIAFFVNSEVADIAGPFAALGVAALMALYPAVAALLYGRWRRFRPWATPLLDGLALAIFWSVLEVLRGVLFTGFPWNPIGSVWALSPVLLQSAAIWGVFGLGLLTLVAVMTPLAFVETTARRRYGPPLLAVLGLCVLAVFGTTRIRDLGEHPDIRLRLVQANVNQQEKWQKDRLSENFTRHIEISRDGVDGSAPTHILWPETAVPYFLNRDREYRELVAAVVPPGGYVITGAPRLTYTPEGDPVLGNSMIAVDDIGAVAASYDKSHLVPFGEYLPLRQFLLSLGFERFVPSMLGMDFTAGPGPQTVIIPGLPAFSPLICYEIIFPGAVVRRDHRPEWILNLTNDGWYGKSSGPYQHLVAAQLRAVEEGLPVVRVAGTGISAVIDPYGRIMARLKLGERGFIDSALPRMIEKTTIFASYGYWCYFSLLGILAALVAWWGTAVTGGNGRNN